MAKYEVRYMFDWGSGVCVWTGNDASRELFGDYPVETELLPVSDELKAELERLICWYDKALNWDDPGGPLLWDQTQIDEFNKASRVAYRRLVDELGQDYDVEFFEEGLTPG